MEKDFKSALERKLSSIFGGAFVGLKAAEFTDRDGEVWINLTVLIDSKSAFSDADLLMRATSAVRKLERDHAIDALSIPYYTDSNTHSGHAA